MSNLNKYRVAYNQMNRNVHILNEDQQETEGHKIVGEFEADPITGEFKGDHEFEPDESNVLISASKAVLRDLGITDFDNVVYEDKASNAPRGGYVLSHKEREQAIQEGESPADKAEEITENMDAAEKKFSDKPIKRTKRKAK